MSLPLRAANDPHGNATRAEFYCEHDIELASRARCNRQCAVCRRASERAASEPPPYETDQEGLL